MIQIVGLACAALIFVGVAAALVRLFVGPNDANRAIGSDLLFFSVVGLFALGGVIMHSPYLFDLVLVGSTVGFLATLALARAIMRGRH